MTVTGIVWLVVIVLLVGTVWFFYAKISRFIRSVFGSADALKEMIQDGEEDAKKPKSLSGATDLVLPRIRADFPEFHWPEFRAEAEKLLKEHLKKEGCADILIHRTVLNDYKKEKGNCYAILFSAVQYKKEDKPVQSRWSVTMGYVQDADKAGYENGIGLKCPSCGAPVKNLGEKKCQYCGTPIEEINIRIWRPVRIAEE